MKIYYILYSLCGSSDLNFFLQKTKEIKTIEDIDTYIDKNYYRVGKKIDLNTQTLSTIVLEAWIFMKRIWLEYGIAPIEIEWIYKEDLVILNDDLWINRDNNWIKISTGNNIYFFTSRYAFSNPFWFLWEKLSQINPNFPKLIFPNKNLQSYYRNDKIGFIINIYEKREELIGNFMISLFRTKSHEYIKKLFELRKKNINSSDILLKVAWKTDNGKDIKLLNIDELLKRRDLIDYLKLKFIDSINDYTSNIYFTDFYDIKKEIRLYFAKNIEGKYVLYSVKHKKNLTSKAELFFTENLSTGKNLRVTWELGKVNEISNLILQKSEYILNNNNREVCVIEFVETTDGKIKFLELNNLGGSLMFEGEDEENIKNRIGDWWSTIFKKNMVK